jgi:hypothetical protein
VSMLQGLALGTELDVTGWLVFERAPLRARCSAYTTLVWIEDVSRLARLCLRLTVVSVSLYAKRKAVSHKPFQSPYWKCSALEIIYRTRSHGQQRGKELRNAILNVCIWGYLSATSRTRCTINFFYYYY